MGRPRDTSIKFLNELKIKLKKSKLPEDKIIKIIQRAVKIYGKKQRRLGFDGARRQDQFVGNINYDMFKSFNEFEIYDNGI